MANSREIPYDVRDESIITWFVQEWRRMRDPTLYVGAPRRSYLVFSARLSWLFRLAAEVYKGEMIKIIMTDIVYVDKDRSYYFYRLKWKFIRK